MIESKLRGWDYQSPLVTTSGDRRHGCDSDGLKLLQAPVSEFIVKGARFWWILAYLHKMVYKTKTSRATQGSSQGECPFILLPRLPGGDRGRCRVKA